MIDWTQPIETTETPPRPVRVLATDRIGICPIVVMFENGDIVAVPLNGCGANNLRLRNVAPPKPEPVLMERWINLYSNLSGIAPALFRSESQALEIGRQWEEFIRPHRLAWMSDGSPVPGGDDPTRYGVCETCVEKAVKRCDELVAERDSLKADLEYRTTLHHRQMAELERMRPVVDAAVAWANRLGHRPTGSYYLPVYDAVRAYQSTPKKTAEEAVANVAKMMGPVKTCNNCKHNEDGTCHLLSRFYFDSNGDCQDWEMKND
jgi:hypothetical protein